jgi:hypothetical protein
MLCNMIPNVLRICYVTRTQPSPPSRVRMPRCGRGPSAAAAGRSGVRGGGALASTAAAAPSFLGRNLVYQASILPGTRTSCRLRRRLHPASPWRPCSRRQAWHQPWGLEVLPITELGEQVKEVVEVAAGSKILLGEDQGLLAVVSGLMLYWAWSCWKWKRFAAPTGNMSFNVTAQ